VSGEGVEALEKFKDVESVGWVDLDDDVRSALSLSLSLLGSIALSLEADEFRTMSCRAHWIS